MHRHTGFGPKHISEKQDTSELNMPEPCTVANNPRTPLPASGDAHRGQVSWMFLDHPHLFFYLGAYTKQ